MERQGFTIPLLIGGATTIADHTAVKIAPAYSGPVVHVLDASRAVGVAGAAGRSPTRHDTSSPASREEYEAIRRERAGQRDRERRASLDEARANHLRIDWTTGRPPAAVFLGLRTFNGYPLAELLEVIDWTPFFATWELRGTYPAILDDPRLGAAARDLHARCPGPARSHRRRGPPSGRRGRGLLAGQRRRRRHRRCGPTSARPSLARPSARCASRWPRPTAAQTSPWPTSWPRSSTGLADYVGGFAVTTGHGLDARGRIRGGPRRLLGDHGQGAGRSPRRSLRRTAPRAGPPRAVGLCAGRAALQRRPHRRALPGHPPGTRLSGLPGPHREGHLVRRCSRSKAAPGSA